MAKKVLGAFKLQIKAGEASMAPPVGPAFGQRGLNGMEFVKQFNAKTQGDKGMLLPVQITFFSDKSFKMDIKSPPASVLIKKLTNLPKGSPEPHIVKVGKISRAQLEEIVKIKQEDLNATEMDAAVRMIAGTARSMGVTVKD
jgi:large subunit ribosomal protein L11